MVSSFDQHDPGVLLSAEASRRLRQILGNGLVLFNFTVEEVLEELCLTLPLSTSARAFSCKYEEKIRWDYGRLYLGWLSNHSGICRESLEKWVLEDNTDDPNIRRLAASSIYPHTTAGLANLGRRADNLMKTANECLVLLEKPAAGLLPEGVRQTLCRMETAAHSASVTAFRTESDFVRNRFNVVQDRHERRRTIATCVLSWVGVDAMMRGFRLAPQRDVLVETILDRAEDGCIKFGFVDDRPGRQGSRLRTVFGDFDIRSIIDGTVSIRRHRTSLQRYLFDVTDSRAQAAMVAEDTEVLAQAFRLAVFNISRLSDWLLDYASPDCWRKRKKDHDESWPDAE